MSISDIGTFVIGWIVAYGPPVVGGILFLGALGIPLPLTLTVIASGAFIRQNLLDGYYTPVLGLVATVIGDSLVYGIGCIASARIQSRFGNNPLWKSAGSLFDRRGGITVFLTRWLLMSLALPVSLIAGSSGFGFRKFLAYDALGELVWILLYGGLGYAFGSQWELISGFISDFSGFIFGAVVLGTGVYLMVYLNKRPPRSEAR